MVVALPAPQLSHRQCLPALRGDQAPAEKSGRAGNIIGFDGWRLVLKQTIAYRCVSTGITLRNICSNLETRRMNRPELVGPILKSM